METSNKRLALIIPYRDRRAHLNQFVPHYKRRMRHAKIYVIEQTLDKPFNRGMLINCGFKEFESTFDYFAAHDVDLLCTKGDYSYPFCPTQLATRCQQFKYKMPFPEYFGGATLFRKEDFILCNGFSNNYWSWGGEDEDLRNAVLQAGLKIEHRPCFYQSLHHHRYIDPILHPKNVEMVKAGRQPDDGLSHCQYKVLSQENNRDYVKLTVEI